MENLDVSVLRALSNWRAAGHRALLATVVRTWGSSPRPVGSIMAMRSDGLLVGSVSGGCIEDDLVERFARGDGWPCGAPQFVRYGVSADEAHRFGLPCGGTLELLLEFDPDAEHLAELLALLERGSQVEREVDLVDGRARLRPCDRPARLRLEPQRLVNAFGPAYRLLIIGAGQLGEYLATMALFNGFAVTVCDPRAEHHASWSLAGVELVHEMPDDVVLRLAPDARTAIVALTHDPKLDDLALLEALNSQAFYIGAIGSRRNNRARRQRLIEHFGASERSLRRLRGPIGIHIGSKTPPEIAVSVMAEILAVKNGVALQTVEPVGLAKDRLELAAAGAEPR